MDEAEEPDGEPSASEVEAAREVVERRLGELEGEVRRVVEGEKDRAKMELEDVRRQWKRLEKIRGDLTVTMGEG